MSTQTIVNASEAYHNLLTIGLICSLVCHYGVERATVERSCDIFENLSCHKFQHLVLHLPGDILVDFRDQPRGNGKVVFSTKVDNLC